MGKKIIVVLVLMIAASVLQSTMAQTTHEVGDNMGWIVPPGGPIAYSTWASNQNFRVGDTLLFNFTEGAHNVAKVTKAAYDACNGSNTIGSIITSSPANVTLDSEGEHYFICTFTQHCSLGQKLAINVTTGSSGTAPSPAPATAPTPATYVVGDTIGWLVPPGGPIAYSTWASAKTFRVGDTLLFNFTNGAHNVAEVTKAAYDACTTSSTIGSVITTSPARIRLDSDGQHYYICTFSQHCSLGQKLAINVSGTATPPSTPPSSTATPPSTPPSSSATPPSTPPSSSATPPSTTPSSSATPPTSSATPPSTTPSTASPPTVGGPPKSAAPSVVIAGFSVTFLSIAVAFLL